MVSSIDEHFISVLHRIYLTAFPVSLQLKAKLKSGGGDWIKKKRNSCRRVEVFRLRYVSCIPGVFTALYEIGNLSEMKLIKNYGMRACLHTYVHIHMSAFRSIVDAQTFKVRRRKPYGLTIPHKSPTVKKLLLTLSTCHVVDDRTTRASKQKKKYIYGFEYLWFEEFDPLMDVS